ncbi:MAG TPA: glycosyl hydrolase family 18 protein [Anaerolineae bacterium]|nr:glycosyl hydrolase family 18 protein [Anaerolineae bacterium]
MEQGMNPAFLRSLETLLEGKWAGRIMAFVMIPALFVATILLPPLALPERLLSAGHVTFAKAGGSLVDPDGTQLTIPPGSVSGTVQVEFSSIPRADFLAGSAGDPSIAQAIPSNLDMKSPLYTFSVRGETPEQATLTIPIPNDSEPLTTIDLYAWTGREWQWVPKTVFLEDDLLETNLSFIPPAVAVFQTIPLVPSVSASLKAGETLPLEARDVLVEIEAESLPVQSDGIDGNDTVVAASGLLEQPGEGTSYMVLPTLSNEVEGIVRSDLVNNILVNDELRKNHVSDIVDLVVQNMYPGVNLDYRGMDPGLRDQFTAFVNELAAELHANHKVLAVTVETPVQISEDRWDAGPYDWQAVGQAADTFKVPGLLDPDAYRVDGQMEALLDYAVNNVNRYKTQLILPSYSTDWAGDTVTPRSYAETLQLLSGNLVLAEGRDTFSPGEQITVQLAGGPSSVSFDEQTQYYSFTYSDDKGEHTVYLENATSMAHKLDLASKYNLKGVSVEGLLLEGNDQQMWDVLQEYLNSVTPAADTQFAIVWTVESAVGSSLTQEVGSLSEPMFAWTAPLEGGEYSISAAISDDGGQTAGAQGGRVSFTVAEPTPTPTPTPPPPTPTPRPTGGTTPARPTPAPPSAPPPPGTGFDYGAQLARVSPATLGHLNALGFRWIKLQIRWENQEPSPGAIDWGTLDGVVSLANGGGRKLLFSVVTTPRWARARTEGHGPPDDPNTYGNFVAGIAQRYCGKVQAIEVWNEQNLLTEWNTGRGINAQEYMNLLKIAYQRIKAACPGMIVVSGAPTPTGVSDGVTAIDDAEYLRRMYNNGLKNYCDAVGVHPSGFDKAADDTAAACRASGGTRCHRSYFFSSTIQAYHDIMVQNGDGNKKLWATEFGWATIDNMSAAPNPGYEYAATNTEASQADNLVKAMQIAKQSGYMGVMFIWNLDFSVEVGAWWEGSKFSILRADGTPRPAYNALARMAK